MSADGTKGPDQRIPDASARLSDEQLIAAFQQGSEAAFGELVERYQDPLTSFCTRFVGDHEEAVDLVQEAFVRLYRKKHAYKPVARFSTWLYAIAANLAKSYLRRQRLRRSLGFVARPSEDQDPIAESPDRDPLPDIRADSALKEQRISKALAGLPEKYREAVVLREIQELSYEEIAAITRSKVGTVKSRINRGKAILQEKLRDIWD